MKKISLIPSHLKNTTQSKKKQHNTKLGNIHKIENKLTRFQIYHESEFPCKCKNPLYKTQHSEIIVEYDKSFDMTTGKIKYNP